MSSPKHEVTSWNIAYWLMDEQINQRTDKRTSEQPTERTSQRTNVRKCERTNERTSKFSAWFWETPKRITASFWLRRVLIAKRAEPIRKWRININCGGWTFMLSFLIYVEWLLPLSVQLIFPHDHGLLLSGNHTPHNDGLKTSAWCRRTDQSARDCCFRSPVVFRLAARVREMWTLLVY